MKWAWILPVALVLVLFGYRWFSSPFFQKGPEAWGEAVHLYVWEQLRPGMEGEGYVLHGGQLVLYSHEMNAEVSAQMTELFNTAKLFRIQENQKWALLIQGDSMILRRAIPAGKEKSMLSQMLWRQMDENARNLGLMLRMEWVPLQIQGVQVHTVEPKDWESTFKWADSIPADSMNLIVLRERLIAEAEFWRDLFREAQAEGLESMGPGSLPSSYLFAANGMLVRDLTLEPGMRFGNSDWAARAQQELSVLSKQIWPVDLPLWEAYPQVLDGIVLKLKKRNEQDRKKMQSL